MFVLKSTYDNQVAITQNYIDECVELRSEVKKLKLKLDKYHSKEAYDSLNESYQSSQEELEDLRDVLRSVRDYLAQQLHQDSDPLKVKVELDQPHPPSPKRAPDNTQDDEDTIDNS